MATRARIRYYGWSSLAIDAPNGTIVFDPFYREYCGAKWSSLDDYSDSDIVCVTHGHEEHFLDAPEVIRTTGATVVASDSVCRFLSRRRGIPPGQLRPVAFDQTVEVGGMRITTFGWKHRDINLAGALSKALLHGNATQLKWFWSSATKAPFYAPYTGFHVELPDGTTILNYNEGFNTKMTDAEIAELGRRFRVDVLLAGMQLHFTADLERGVAALKPRSVLLYPPHDKFHEWMGAKSAPWSEFAAAAQRAAPAAAVVTADPGQAFDYDPQASPVLRPAEGEGPARTPRRAAALSASGGSR